jgi:HK97 family phage major capsid protein
VPRELVDDALFDITSLVTEMLGIRLARKMASDYAVGIGSTAPVGLFDRTSLTNQTWVLSTGLVQATANQQLQAFIHNLDPAYVNENSSWVMNWGTHGVLMGFSDSTNRPLMVSYASSGLGIPPQYTLLGFPVKIDQAAPAFSLTAAASPAAVNVAYMAFGDIAEGFMIRDVQGIGIAVDPYTGIGSNQVLYFGYARTDSQIRNSAAYELLPGYHV